MKIMCFRLVQCVPLCRFQLIWLFAGAMEWTFALVTPASYLFVDVWCIYWPKIHAFFCEFCQNKIIVLDDKAQS